MEEMMMVSMVIPDTGLRAVVAMALAATEAKKNEKTSVSQAGQDDRRRGAEMPSRRPTPRALTTTRRREST
jgi:hypothetical protein